MVLITILELGIKMTWWSVKSVYNLGYYMVYGSEKNKNNPNEIYLQKIEELDKQILELKTNMDTILNKPTEIKN
jgi:hypothetical protein